jgi:hypothetical protein
VGLLDAFRKGDIPADTGEPVYDGWEEVPADDYDGSADGDNSGLAAEYGHLVTADQVARHLLEEKQ